MIERIDRAIIWNGRATHSNWFHPRACMVPARPQPMALMTCQAVLASDVFGPVHWSMSLDQGATWTWPEPIEAFGRRALADGLEEGVCDVVPQYHPLTGTVLAMGHNVYYQDNVLTRPDSGRFVVYAVRDALGRWSQRRELRWDDPRATALYTCGCGQRVTLEDGNILVPLSFRQTGREDRAVGSVLCAFDGRKVRVLQSGNDLRLEVGRGLLEPSLARFGGRFYMTIRAEDGHGYVSFSDDGLEWADPQPWCWEDGQPLAMSTTQQHWLVHSDGLFLVYTRQSEDNARVFRWRAPLYVAQVDVATLRLRRETEQVVLPIRGDPIQDPEGVARLGNFHVTTASARESWVTVTEERPGHQWHGDTLLARIRWALPNRLVR